MSENDDLLLQVKNLHTYFRTRAGTVKAVNDVSYDLYRGKTLGIVGESGSGKSVSAMSILRLTDANGYIASGKILFCGKDLVTLPMREMYGIRGNRISVIFQEPMTSLNPVFTIGRQLSEPFLLHRGMKKEPALREARAMLEAVHIPNPDALLRRYPHQLSGGMRQRVMIAMALACRPDILIADEPTTALDVTIQAQILRLMNDLQRENGTAILFITHDLGVIRETADDVVVMYCGQAVEQAPAKLIFTDCAYSHPYTEGLMNSIPKLNDTRKRLDPIPGSVPHPLSLPEGCKFAPRCRYCTQKCITDEPELLPVTPNQKIRCHYPEKAARRSPEHEKITLRPSS